MVKITECPACSSENIEHFLNVKDYFLTKETFDIWHCKGCGLKFTNPVPRETDLPKYYESDEYISHSNTSEGFINKIYQLVRNYSIRRKADIAAENINRGEALDIGCGTGDFLNEMSKKGWKVKGIEPNDTARNNAINNFNLEVYPAQKLFEFEENSFDVITMWHVLEHVYNLHNDLTQISKLLRNEGKLVIALPNADSMDADIYKKYWAAYDVPRHLYHFNQKSLSLLMEKFGFELISVKPMVFDSFYISMLSEKYKRGKVNYITAFFNGLKTDFYGLFNKKYYSSLIYILKAKNT